MSNQKTLLCEPTLTRKVQALGACMGEFKVATVEELLAAITDTLQCLAEEAKTVAEGGPPATAAGGILPARPPEGMTAKQAMDEVARYMAQKRR